MTLAERVAAQPWYHTIDLGNGVVTNGLFDTRKAAERCGLPASLAGKRCLDVGTANGFWAFELERRGAAEVVALDVDDTRERDWPDNVPAEVQGKPDNDLATGFALAHEALGSKVKRLDLRVYDLDPDVHGRFDFVFMGSLLLHLRDPVAALRAIRGVIRPEGEFLSADSISLSMSLLRPLTAATKLEGRGYSRWHTPNVRAHRRWLDAAGFDVIDEGRIYFIPVGPGMPRRLPKLGRAYPRDLALRLMLLTLGIPSTWARCRPRPGLP